MDAITIATQTQDLKIGGVTLKSWEVPSDLADLFGVTKLAIHDFPGGDRTVQNLGNFPEPEISWEGKLWDGDTGQGVTAYQRATQLNQLRNGEQVVSLTFGQFNYQVVVHEFRVTVFLKQYLGYKLTVVPVKDQTSTANAADPPLPETILAEALTNFQQKYQAPSSGVALPTNIVTESQAITDAINTAMTLASQQLSAIPPQTINAIQQQINRLQQDLNGLFVGTNYGLSSSAQDLYGASGTLSTALGATTGIIRTVSCINPNLMRLASQFYGNARQWTLIAFQNNLQDYEVTGSFVLTIPSLGSANPFVTG